MSQILQPSVSVCIPVFNGENYLSNCINSIIDQEYENFEILIVDNCSTDSTADIVSSFKDSRIRFIKNDFNIGSLKNFSKCVENARGEYFVLLPHDDMLLPGCLKEFTSKMSNQAIGIVFGAVMNIDKNGSVIRTRTDFQSNKTLSKEESLVNLVDNFMPIQLAMVRTKVLRKLDGFKTEFSLFSDCHLWFRVALDGWESFYCSKAFSSHRIHDNQGQKAFLTQDLKVASEHMGKKLDEEFWKEHNYNYLFLRLSKWLLSEMINKSYDHKTLKHVKKSLLKEISSVHMISILSSLVKRNRQMFNYEVKLIIPMVSFYGFFNVFSCYLSVFFSLLKRKTLNLIT